MKKPLRIYRILILLALFNPISVLVASLLYFAAIGACMAFAVLFATRDFCLEEFGQYLDAESVDYFSRISFDPIEAETTKPVFQITAAHGIVSLASAKQAAEKVLMIAPVSAYLVSRLATRGCLAGLKSGLILAGRHIPAGIILLQRFTKYLSKQALWIRDTLAIVVYPIARIVFRGARVLFIYWTQVIGYGLQRLPPLLVYIHRKTKMFRARIIYLCIQAVDNVQQMYEQHLASPIEQLRQVCISMLPHVRNLLVDMVSRGEYIFGLVKPTLEKAVAFVTLHISWFVLLGWAIVRGVASGFMEVTLFPFNVGLVLLVRIKRLTNPWLSAIQVRTAVYTAKLHRIFARQLILTRTLIHTILVAAHVHVLYLTAVVSQTLNESANMAYAASLYVRQLLARFKS